MQPLSSFMWRYYVFASPLLFLVALMGSPSFSGEANLMKTQSQKKWFTLGPSDVVNIRVYENADLSGRYVVDGQGRIAFPLLGVVNLQGLDVMEAQALLTRRLEKDFLRNPIVNLTVEKGREKMVKIYGTGGEPGIYTLDQPTRFFDLLSRSPFSPALDKITAQSRVRILRKCEGQDCGKTPGSVVSLTVDLYRLLNQGDAEENIFLQDGDVLFMPAHKAVHVIGEVKKPGTIPFQNGMTVLQAVSMAGGVTSSAASRKIFIKTIKDGKEVRQKVKPGHLLKPDDIVEIPLSFW